MSGSTGVCSEAHRSQYPTDFSPTSRLPSQFLPAPQCHCSFLWHLQVPGGPLWQTGGVLVQLHSMEPPLQWVLFPLPRWGGQAFISSGHSCQVSLFDFLCHTPGSGQVAGGRRRAGERWWADGVNIHATFPRETRLKGTLYCQGIM